MTGLDAAVERFAAGGMVFLGDAASGIAFAATPAEAITQDGLAALAGAGGGMVVLALDQAITERLRLTDAAGPGRRRAELPFVLPIDAAHGVGGGWSVADRALTMRVAAAPATGPDDLVVPGLVQPVRARRADLLAGGRTAAATARSQAVPAALELAHRAGRREAVALCAVVDGRAARATLPRAEPRELRARAEADAAVRCALPTAYGPLRAVAQATSAGGTTLALVHGDLAAHARPAVTAHTACLLGDTLGSLLCDCRSRLDLALDGIVAEGAGVVLYTKQPDGLQLACPQAAATDALAVAGLLGSLGVRTLRLDATDATLAPALRGLGLDVEPLCRGAAQARLGR
ncbi:MAG TPA: 3,4-dihydroxy-2-butanone-4-phosphate synthase [Solirubrobacteraceae bacterium]|nr:3,4-dihydroxy-2-butanone-4-phosphate synthase [Solirubrobacteraceae bacterium]